MRLLTGLSIAAAGVGAYFMLRKKKRKTKRNFRQNMISGKVRNDLEKTINRGIHRLLNTSDDLIRDYSKRSHKTLRQAKKRKKYVTL